MQWWAVCAGPAVDVWLVNCVDTEICVSDHTFCSVAYSEKTSHP